MKNNNWLIVNKKRIRNQIKQIKKMKWQNNKKEEQTQGGFGPEMKVCIELWGPFRSQLGLTFWIECACVDSWAWCSSLLGPWICTDGHLADSWMRCMICLLWNVAQESIRKNNMELWGDLGIEPRSQWCLATSPTTEPSVRVC